MTGEDTLKFQLCWGRDFRNTYYKLIFIKTLHLLPFLEPYAKYVRWRCIYTENIITVTWQTQWAFSWLAIVEVNTDNSNVKHELLEIKKKYFS